MKRGVIAAPGIIRRIPGGLVVDRSLTPEDIRFYLLYWHRVVIPSNNLVYLGVPDEKELIDSGAIERPRVQYTGRFQGDAVATAMLAAQGIVAGRLASDESTDWALHQFGGDVVALGESATADALRIRLASALPVPPSTMPIAEVLEFRERRASQLASLHDALDELYREILEAPDRNLASRKALTRLTAEISGVMDGRPTRNGWPRFDLTTEFSLSRAARGLLMGMGVAVPLHLPAGIAAVATGILSVIDVKACRTTVVGKDSGRLAYLTSAKRESLLK